MNGPVWSAARGIERVIVVVLDGVSSDAVWLYGLPNLERLAARGAFAANARTVTPSITAAALTSLFTGVPPRVHGIESDRFGMPRDPASLSPLPGELMRHGLPTSTFLAELPRAYRGIAERIVSRMGVRSATFRGAGAAEILMYARDSIETQRSGLMVLHWPDADRAGHAHGWLSPAYELAVRKLDALLGLLVAVSGVESDPATLLIALADHGGGGARANDHDSNDPHDMTVPLLVLGGQVRRMRIARPVSLLDVPATVLWALGLPIPPSYCGVPLREALDGAGIAWERERYAVVAGA